MQVIIKSRQMQVTPQLRAKIERKVQRLARLVDGDSRVEVTVTEEQTRSAADRFSVQLALASTTHPIHSEVSALNATTALDLVIDKVVTQLGRQKDRQTTVRRHHTPGVKVLSLSRGGFLSSLDEEELERQGREDGGEGTATMVGEEQNEAIWSRVLEIRQVPTTPMGDQEVIALMERDGMMFYPFYNAETRSVNVMYRLEQGGYGLLVPAMD